MDRAHQIRQASKWVTYGDAYGDGDAAPESGGVLFATDSGQAVGIRPLGI